MKFSYNFPASLINDRLHYLLMNLIIIVGLALNLVAAFLTAYGPIFRSKATIRKESKTSGEINLDEERHRIIETRVAQIGAILLFAGFAVQIVGNVLIES